MISIRKHIKLITYAGILLISMLIANNILFTHIQPIADGTFVVHAHPYDKTENPPTNHEHSEKEIFFLSTISLLGLITLPIFYFIVQFRKKDKHKITLPFYKNVHRSNIRGRSPPSTYPYL